MALQTSVALASIPESGGVLANDPVTAVSDLKLRERILAIQPEPAIVVVRRPSIDTVRRLPFDLD